MIGGAAFRELAEGWEELAPTLLTPPLEFGIIAGGRGNDKGYNPFVPGDNDAVVSVESTRLDGASDFRVLPLMHTFMMNDATLQEYTLRFLQKGHFTTEDDKTPIDASS
jgi:hypothetical protein